MFEHSQAQYQPQLLLPKSLHLLILENSQENINAITFVLENAGVQVTYEILQDCQKYQELLEHNCYDAVILNDSLPNCHSLAAFEKLKTLGQPIPFIIITEKLVEQETIEGLKAGITDYILKQQLFRLPIILGRWNHEFICHRQQQTTLEQIQVLVQRETITTQIVQEMGDPLIPEEVLQSAVNQLQETLQVDRCILGKMYSDQQIKAKYISEGTAERKQLLGQICPLSQKYQQILNHGELVVFNHLDDLPLEVQAIARKLHLVAFMIVPIIYGKTLAGCICLHQCQRQCQWQKSDITLVQRTAAHCAIAIHQAQLDRKIQTELTERSHLEAQLRYNALHDPLTGLPNRALFMDRLEHLCKLTRRRYRFNGGDCVNHNSHNSQHHNAAKSRDYPFQFAVLFLDLDGFKVINDSLGHLVGDQLLQQVAHRLQNCLRAGDTIARLGGDEFVIILEDIADKEDAILVSQRIHQELMSPIPLNHQEIFVSASIGIAYNSVHSHQPSQFMSNAEIAMYHAKGRGRGNSIIFNPSMHTRALKQLHLENDLRRAIENQKLQLYYQPLVSLDTISIEGFEALIRWQHPQRGWISPIEFIPIAEETGLIMPLGIWVLQQACQQLSHWQQQFPELSPLTMNVNLSGKQFAQSDLISQVDEILADTGLNGENLKLEITESVLIENAVSAREMLQQLQERNIQVCLDDFGTGYSSLSYLHRFPINTLKIDRSFVMRLGGEVTQCEVVKAIVNLGLDLGLNVVAEGVETAEQFALLRSKGCHYGQGYWFSRPIDSQSATQLLSHNRLRPQFNLNLHSFSD